MRRKIKRKIREIVNTTRWIKNVRKTIALKRLRNMPPGSPAWLVETEIRYGGPVYVLPRNVISPHNPRRAASSNHRMQGGDRMSRSHHGYAEKYAQRLAPFLKRENDLTIVEIGILQGTGLAIWSDLFPGSRLIGLDVDLANARGNLANLRKAGAFRKREPELYEFDQFEASGDAVKKILQGDRVDVFMDDGCHVREAILKTMESLMPHMADAFVYFVEDNDAVSDEIRALYPECEVESAGELTVVSHARRSP